ncbi:MAG TPA: sugar kinase [Candidatus Micrarchaeia archaeon]|nr:sugar kinase [Candidatus Micrarchaeia archaeon]
MSRVVVVGDVLADVSVHLQRPIAEDSDTPAAITLHPGGSAANLAAWLVTLGTESTVVGAIGDDRLGRIQADELERVGVRTRLTVLPDAATGVVVALVAADGRRSLVTSRGAAGRLVPEHLPEALFRRGAHLHLSGYVLLDPATRAAGLAALRLARRAGMTVSVDPSSSEPLRLVGPIAFRTWTRGVDVLLPNWDEGRVLTGLEDPDAIGAALARTHLEVVMTLGPKGVLWVGPDGSHRAAALPTPVVDTTGAGDAFAGGWLAGWLAGQRGAAPLHRGLAAAALCVAHVGARPAGAR